MNYFDNLNTAVTLTRRMLEAAKSGHWDQVVEFEKRRQILIDLMEKPALDELTPLAVHKDHVTEKLQDLIALNEQILELGAQEKSECFSRFSSSKKTKKAFNAYAGY